MRSHHLTCLFVATLTTVGAKGQLTLDHTLSPQEMVEQYLLGDGVQVMNVVFNAQADSILWPYQAAGFTANDVPALPPQGIVLSTGPMEYVADSAVHFSGWSFDMNEYDGDIGQLTGQISVNAAMLEFDLIPEGDTLRLTASLASEEHPEYVCSTYNDAMGAFISGPGIIGIYSNNAVNMSLLQGTDSAITVNTIRVPDTAFVACDAVNTPLYIDNRENPYMVFDGMTAWLNFVQVVQPGEVYHIKISVSDVYDGSWDSGLFLPKGGLTTEAGNTTMDEVSRTTATGWWDATGTLHVRGWSNGKGILDLLDMSGRVVRSIPSSGTIAWTCPSLAAGTYFVRSPTNAALPVLRTMKP